MPDSNPLSRTAFRFKDQNRPALNRNTVRHQTGKLSAITLESVSGMVRITQVRIVRESDAAGVLATAKKHAISEQTLYLWRKKFGTLEASDVKRLKQLEIENGRLEKMVAERDLELEVMKEINAKKW